MDEGLRTHVQNHRHHAISAETGDRSWVPKAADVHHELGDVSAAARGRARRLILEGLDFPAVGSVKLPHSARRA